MTFNASATARVCDPLTGYVCIPINAGNVMSIDFNNMIRTALFSGNDNDRKKLQTVARYFADNYENGERDVAARAKAIVERLDDNVIPN